PESGFRGTTRPQSQSLFRRAYEYEADATGLRGVAIPVWTTKAFTARWEAPLAGLPLDADLEHQGEQASGTLTSHLPFDLYDAGLFYRERWYPFDAPLAGTPSGSRPMKVLLEGQHRGLDIPQWAAAFTQPRFEDGAMGDDPRPGYDPTGVLRQVLLYQRGVNFAGGARNQSLRHLDQSWRIDGNNHKFREEATRDAI